MNKQKLIYLEAAILGALCFVAVYGIRILNPFYDDWLLGRGDLTQHYLGWCFFREDAWHFPFGLTRRLAYPDYSSVIYTDSIPLLAVFFKLLSPILPETFQYFGIWGLVCFMLQGFFAAKILSVFRLDRLPILTGSILFILSPMVIEKMFRHTALGGHWIILASIYLFICHGYLYKNVAKSSLLWGLIGAYTASVHMYFLPMCGAFLCGFVLCSLLKERRRCFKHILPGVWFSVGLIGCTYLLGGFSTRAEAGSSDLGEFSFNLNGFFNSKGYSKVFPALTTYYDGQYEGFAYLGLGVMILIAIVILCLVKRIFTRPYRGRNVIKRDRIMYGIVLLLISAGLTVLAASPEVTLGNRLLFVLTDSSTLTHYWSMFRSTGRIIWPVWYLIVTGAVVANSKLLFGRKKYAAAAVLMFCTALQLFDLSGKLKGQHNTFAQEAVYESPLKSDIWQQLSENEAFEHIVWVSHNIDNNGIMHVAWYAYENGLTMNNYYFARGINVNENTKKSLEEKDKSCIYLFRGDETQGIEDYGLNLYEADGYILGTVDAAERK